MTDKHESFPAGTLRLVIAKGPDTGKSFSLESNREYTVGRAEGCDIRVASDKMVSRKHVLLKAKAGTSNIVLENLSKTNPIIINSQRIETSRELKDGDEIICGTVKLQFKLL